MPEGPPVTVSVTGPLIFTDPEFTLRAALDGLGVVYSGSMPSSARQLGDDADRWIGL